MGLLAMASAGSEFTVRIACLANSRKWSGRCVAGKELDGAGRWVRPVSLRPTREVAEAEQQYADGAAPAVLDIVEIPCTGRAPAGHQIENVVVDSRFYWKRLGRVDWRTLCAMVDRDSMLWTNGHQSQHGQNNRVPQRLLRPQEGSLRLIALDRVVLDAGPKAPELGDQKRVVRATFEYRGAGYRLAVTDPRVEAYCLAAGDGQYTFGSVLACVSLGEIFEGHAYKLVASLITRKVAERNG